VESPITDEVIEGFIDKNVNLFYNFALETLFFVKPI